MPLVPVEGRARSLESLCLDTPQGIDFVRAVIVKENQ